MQVYNIYQLLLVDEHSITPKYLQISNAIIKGVETGKIEQGYTLPSINELSYELEISRDTAEKAYRYLKKRGVIGSIPGKGYFVLQTSYKQPLNIFLLFNKLSTHKKIIYDAFSATLGDAAAIDFYIYNNDFALFKKLLLNRRYDYTHYVIIPHFLEAGHQAHVIINTLPTNQLLLLDKLVPGVEGNYAAVYEDFENDIYQALFQALERLSLYPNLAIIFPNDTYHPQEILKGFYRFCDEFAFTSQVVHHLNTLCIQKGTVYISLMENDLVILIEKILATEWEVGKEVGVISYNETPLKKIILKGITTISTDFQKMGERAAELILSGSLEQIAIPFYLTLRASV